MKWHNKYPQRAYPFEQFVAEHHRSKLEPKNEPVDTGIFEADSRRINIYFELRKRPMPKPKRKLTAAERRAKKERQKNFQWIFINGKQVRARRPETIDGLPVDEFIARNADPIWLHQNEMWEHLDMEETESNETRSGSDDVPF